MTRDSVRKLLERMNIHIRASDPNGVTVQRSANVIHVCGEYRKAKSMLGSSYGLQEWRLYCGSGIACNSGRWWLRYEQREPHGRLQGPYATLKSLEQALRQWRRWDLP